MWKHRGSCGEVRGQLAGGFPLLLRGFWVLNSSQWTWLATRAFTCGTTLAAINVIFIEWQIAYFMVLGVERDGIEVL